MMMMIPKSAATAQRMVSVLMESIPVPNHPIEEKCGERGGDAEEEGDDDVFHISFLSVFGRFIC
jgi:hypothetical protein